MAGSAFWSQWCAWQKAAVVALKLPEGMFKNNMAVLRAASLAAKEGLLG
jgi:hypothetical protein